MNYDINLNITWPHDRLLIGWSFLNPDSENDFYTLEFFFTIVSLQINWE
jgi:hypothetical protein